MPLAVPQIGQGSPAGELADRVRQLMQEARPQGERPAPEQEPPGDELAELLSRAHAEHELLAAIIEASDDAIISATPAGVVSTWNPGAELLYGLSAGATIGRPLVELVVPERLAGEERAMLARAAAGERIDHHETEHRRRDGSPIQVSVTCSPIRGGGGAIAGVSMIVRDVGHKRTELEVERDAQDAVWAERIRGALNDNSFVLFAQPVLDLRSGKFPRVEVLLRMRGEPGTKELISPGDFLDAAERTGLIGDVDRWVLREVMPLLRGNMHVSANLSARTIGDFELTQDIERLLAEYAVDAAKLTVEVPESAAVQDVQSARLFAERLHATGCSLALDDFGTGYGSFTYLKHMSVQYLKIDMQFIRDLVHSEPDQRVVRSIVRIAEDFELSTIAEGVENAETLELLRDYGVHYAQGYFLGRPAPVVELQASVAPPGTT